MAREPSATTTNVGERATRQITTKLREPAQASELLAAGLAWPERYELVRARFNQAGYTLAESTVQKALGVESWRQAVRDDARMSAGDFDRLVTSATRKLVHLIARRRWDSATANSKCFNSSRRA